MGDKMKNCLNCGKEFEDKGYKYHSKYCCNQCRFEFYQKNRVDYSKEFGYVDNNICSSTKGRVSELLVCINFFQRGYYVYHSLSPTAPFDLVAYNPKNQKLIRVEVKSAWSNGYIPKVDQRKFDILAVVYPHEIKYKPNIGYFEQDIQKKV